MAETSERMLEVLKNLENAITEYQKINAEEHGDVVPIVIGWVVVLASTNYEDYGRETIYTWIAPETQPMYHSSGLIKYADSKMF